MIAIIFSFNSKQQNFVDCKDMEFSVSHIKPSHNITRHEKHQLQPIDREYRKQNWYNKNKLPDVYTVKATVRILKEYYLDSNFVLGNAVAPPDYPIVYCSDGFCELTGYTCILFKVILYQK